MEESKFIDARCASESAFKHKCKVDKNENKRAFVDIYIGYKSGNDEGIQKIAKEYLLIKENIVVGSFFGERPHVSDDKLEEIFIEIKQMSSKDVISLYESYLRKIKLGYHQEYVDSALHDAKTAYHTFRKCRLADWNCPEEMIAVAEMENLYLLLKGKDGQGEEVKKQQTQKSHEEL